MKRLLAVQWDRYEVRCVLADCRRGNVRLRAVHAEPIPDADAEADEPSAAEPGATLAKVLTKLGGHRGVTLVGVDRGDVELMHFTLPPARDGELHELVSNEVLRESPAGLDQSVLDFVPQSDDPDQIRDVAVALLPQARLEQFGDTCAAAGLKPDRLPLRPYAAASLFRRAASPSEGPCLLVAPVWDEVDLTVFRQGKAVLSRTVRLPERVGTEAADRRLMTEITRTLAVATQDQLHDDPVQRIVVFDRRQGPEGLPERIHRELQLPVERLDPFEPVDAGRAELPERPGRFASLLGMVLDESRGRAHAIDFLHPRKPPKSFDRRRVAGLAGIVVLAAVLAGAYVAWDTLATARADRDELAVRLKQLDEGPISAAMKQRDLMAAIRDWQDGGVNWLEELRELSVRFPPQQDVVLTQMSMTSLPDGGGDVAFQGLVRDSSIVLRIETNLRDEYHRVNSRSVHQGSQGEDYARRFAARMAVAKRDKSQYVPEPSAEPTATGPMKE